MTDQPAPESQDFVVKRRKIWPAVLACLIGAAVITFFVIRASRAPEPTRILLAIDLDGLWWEGSESAAELSDKVGQRLAKLGFDVVKGGDPEATKILEKSKSPADAAKSLRAGILVEAKIAPEEIRHDLAGGYTELRVESNVTIRFSGESPKDAGKLSGFAGAKDPKAARKLLAGSMADQTFDAIIATVLAHPSIKEILDKRATKESAGLAPAKEYAERRDKMMKDTLDSYKKLRDTRILGERGEPKPLYLSPVSAQDELGAVGPKGYLASTNDIHPFFMPDREAMGYYLRLESLEWRPIDRPTEDSGSAENDRSVWRGYNAFGYPSATSDGKVVAFVEDLFGWAKTVSIIEGGKSRRLKVDPEHRFVDPHVAPGGKSVAVWDRPCYNCPGDLLVLSVADGSTLFRATREGGSFGGYTWLGADQLLVLHTSSGKMVDAKVFVPLPPAAKVDEPTEKKDTGKPAPAKDIPAAEDPGEDEEPKLVRSLFLVDLAVKPVRANAVETVPPSTTISLPHSNPTGTLVVFDSARDVITTWDPKSHTFGAIAITGLAKRPSFSPDGKLLTFELYAESEGAEIAVIPVSGGRMSVLTKNNYRDRYPHFSHDGARIVYETLDEDPSFPKSRSLAWVASVPANKAAEPIR